MFGAPPPRSPARRAQLAVLAPARRVEVPAERLFRPPGRAHGTASLAQLRADDLGVPPAPVYIELPEGVSYLAAGSCAADPLRHRLRRPGGARHVAALEPVRRGREHLLLVQPAEGADVHVDGQPIVGLGLLRPGRELSLGAALVAFTTYQPPATVDVGLEPALAGRRCALCRGRLEAGVRAVRCGCGAVLHAGWSPPLTTFDPPHRCAALGDCPDCGAELPREEGHEWTPRALGIEHGLFDALRRREEDPRLRSSAVELMEELDTQHAAALRLARGALRP